MAASDSIKKNLCSFVPQKVIWNQEDSMNGDREQCERTDLKVRSPRKLSCGSVENEKRENLALAARVQSEAG